MFNHKHYLQNAYSILQETITTNVNIVIYSHSVNFCSIEGK